MAKTIFADLTTRLGYNKYCLSRGSLGWKQTHTYKNAIPNELFLLTAIRCTNELPATRGREAIFIGRQMNGRGSKPAG